jgi:glyoxylase-like metal-dependent hydrolase (beta-lactamase superfamily II)/outer membrane lipoprotein-sorting protein
VALFLVPFWNMMSFYEKKPIGVSANMKKSVLILLILCFTKSYTVFGQAENPTKNSYRKAFSVVAASFEAMGGAANFNKIEDISFTLAGNIYARNQSWQSFTAFDKFPIETKAILDLKKERVSWEQKNSLPGGLFFANRNVASRAEAGFNLNLERKNHTVTAANAPVLGLVSRLISPYFLKKLLEQKASLRYVGEANFNGKKHDLVSVVWNNQVFTLYFDAATKFLSKHETVLSDTAVGDDFGEFVTADYQNFEGVMLPTKYQQWQSGKLIRESNFTDYKFNQKPDESLFKLPADYPLFANTPFAIKKLAENIFLADGAAGGGYRVLFVGLKDGILVVDAPGNSQVSTQIIGEIKKAIPNKPIKYLVLTHFHGDHTGGTRPYIAEGAKIITTAKNRSFFEQMAKAEFTITPDVLSNAPKIPDFMFVEDAHKFEDEQPVVIRNIKSVHAEDMYLVYLPKEKLFFQSDLYNWGNNAVTDSTVDMVGKIAKFNWEVETMISSHGGIVPYKQVLDEVKEFKAKK